MASNGTGTGYHVVAAVGAESYLMPLLKLGCALASARSGRVTILSVTANGRRPVWLDDLLPARCMTLACLKVGHDGRRRVMAARRCHGSASNPLKE